MFALLILPILISGFISLSLSPKKRLLLHRYDGQLLYLKAAKIGFRYFLITLLLIWIFKDPELDLIYTDIKISTIDFPMVTHLANFISSAKNESKVTPETLEASWLISISFITIIFSYIIQLFVMFSLKIQNMIANKKITLLKQNNDIARIAILGKFFSDSPIDYMFYESFKKRKPILVTLKSRKVYVGIVNKLGEPNESKEPNQEISLVTAISGYRDKDSLEVIFTNNYPKIDDKQQPNHTHESIHILRLDQIDSICWYHIETFTQVNGNMQKTRENHTPSSIEKCDNCSTKVKARLGKLYIAKDQ